MKFADFYLKEAKGSKPGDRLHAARTGGGPRGLTSSPIGRDDFNPEIRQRATSPGKMVAPDGGSVTVPKGLSSAITDPVKMLKYVLGIVGASERHRQEFNEALSEHFNDVQNLRIILKRLEGNSKMLDKLEKAKSKLYRDTHPDTEKIAEIEKRIEGANDAADSYEFKSEIINRKIDKELESRKILAHLNEIVKAAAQEFSEKLSPRDKQAIGAATLKDFRELKLDSVVAKDPEQLLLLKKLVLEPGKFAPLEKYYNSVMGSRSSSKESGKRYYFDDPLFHLTTLFKTAAINSAFGPPAKKPIADSHTMRNIAKQSMGKDISSLVNLIKSRNSKAALYKLTDYDNLDDREKKAVESQVNMIKANINSAIGDGDKKSKILGILNGIRTGKATERDLLVALYGINESLNRTDSILALIDSL